jgi:23S rRNA pseudouridine1911/1915/1917 synthase
VVDSRGEVGHIRGVTASGGAAGEVTILFEDRHLVIVCKPVGMDVHGRGGDDPESLIGRVARRLGVSPRALHPAARLDRPVSGVVPIARSKVGRVSLTRQYQDHAVEKRYVAIASAAPSPRAGAWDRPIGVDPRDPRRRAAGGRDALPALTAYEVRADLDGGAALVDLRPRTGRTHQLRVHLALVARCPILGDARYGGPRAVTLDDGRVVSVGRVMLHAAGLVLRHPESGSPLAIEAPPPPDFADLLLALGG